MYMDLIQIIMIIFEANWPNVFSAEVNAKNGCGLQILFI